MKKTYTTNLSVSECKEKFRKNVKLFTYNWWRDKYKGYIFGNRYKLSYHKAEESKIMSGIKEIRGRIYSENGQTFITTTSGSPYSNFLGNIINIVFIILVCLVLQISIIDDFKLIIAIFMLIFVINTILTKTKYGKEREDKALEFLVNLLELVEIENKIS